MYKMIWIMVGGDKKACKIKAPRTRCPGTFNLNLITIISVLHLHYAINVICCPIDTQTARKLLKNDNRIWNTAR